MASSVCAGRGENESSDGEWLPYPLFGEWEGLPRSALIAAKKYEKPLEDDDEEKTLDQDDQEKTLEHDDEEQTLDQDGQLTLEHDDEECDDGVGIEIVSRTTYMCTLEQPTWGVRETVPMAWRRLAEKTIVKSFNGVKAPSKYLDAEKLGYSIVPKPITLRHSIEATTEALAEQGQIYYEELWLSSFINGKLFKLYGGKLTKEAAITLRREKQMMGEWGRRAVGIIKVTRLRCSPWCRAHLVPIEFYPFEYVLYERIDLTFESLKKVCSGAYKGTGCLPLHAFRFETPHGFGIDKDVSLREYFHRCTADLGVRTESVTIEVPDRTIEVPDRIAVPVARSFTLQVAEVVLYIHDEEDDEAYHRRRGYCMCPVCAPRREADRRRESEQLGRPVTD